MGQRSQIYVRYNNRDKKGLIANYYQWNYGERMISRARWGIEHINANLKYDWYFQYDGNIEKLKRIFDTNFDMKDIQMSDDIIKEYLEYSSDMDFNDAVFKWPDNNDGKLFIDISEDGVKYAFLDEEANIDKIMNAEDYMNWNCGSNWKVETKYFLQDTIDTCIENIQAISENAKLMTKEELEEFMNYDFVHDMGLVIPVQDHLDMTIAKIETDKDEDSNSAHISEEKLEI